MRSGSVTVGFSGGIDSSAAVVLMKERFSVVEAATMWLYDGQEEEFDRVRAMAECLGVRHRILDFRRDFEEYVVEPYLFSYRVGETPNPCIFCNRHMKYGKFLDATETDFLALGHYAVLRFDGREYRLFRSGAQRKDQSYHLFHLRQRQLSRLLFPLGAFGDKKDVLDFLSMRVPQYLSHFGPSLGKESMGACFLKGADRIAYLKSLGLPGTGEGVFVDKSGRVLGVHSGVNQFTPGQKPRILKTEKPDGMSSPYKILGTVVKLDVRKDAVVIGGEEDVLFHRIVLEHWNLISPEIRKKHIASDGGVGRNHCSPGWDLRCNEGQNADRNVGCGFANEGCDENRDDCEAGDYIYTVRISQWSESYRCRFRIEGGMMIVETAQPMRAPAPGQAAVLYLGDELIGGGILRLPCQSSFPSSRSS